MCGRTRVALAPEQVAAAAGIQRDELEARWRNRHFYRPSHNASPQFWTPVVRAGAEAAGEAPGRWVESMKWGLVPFWHKSGERPDYFKMFNARSEGVATSPVFSRLLPSKRCVVLANGFFEWAAAAGGKKQPHYVYLKPAAGGDGEEGKGKGKGKGGSNGGGGGSGNGSSSGNGAEGPVMRMAGLWDEFTDEDGQHVRTYTIITCDSSAPLAWLHDRMPVLLRDDAAVARWLRPLGGGDRADLSLLRPYGGSDLAWHPVTQAMSKPHYSGADAWRDVRAAKGSIGTLFARQKQQQQDSSKQQQQQQQDSSSQQQEQAAKQESSQQQQAVEEPKAEDEEGKSSGEGKAEALAEAPAGPIVEKQQQQQQQQQQPAAKTPQKPPPSTPTKTPRTGGGGGSGSAKKKAGSGSGGSAKKKAAAAPPPGVKPINAFFKASPKKREANDGGGDLESPKKARV